MLASVNRLRKFCRHQKLEISLTLLRGGSFKFRRYYFSKSGIVRVISRNYAHPRHCFRSTEVKFNIRYIIHSTIASNKLYSTVTDKKFVTQNHSELFLG